MSRDGDEADVALLVSSRVVVGTDDGQTGVLALSSRVGLERAARKTSHRAEVLGELLRQNGG